MINVDDPPQEFRQLIFFDPLSGLKKGLLIPLIIKGPARRRKMEEGLAVKGITLIAVRGYRSSVITRVTPKKSLRICFIFR
jgi:hypothetical protein